VTTLSGRRIPAVRVRTLVFLSLCLLAGAGCSKEKATPQLIADLKSYEEKDRIIAVRKLQHRQGDAAQVVPALIGALKDKDSDVRWSAAIGLGYYGDQAKDAIPALQEALKDRDARVREGAGVALTRIDPAQFPTKPKAQKGKDKAG
jgi:HEAT repeat protein